MARLPLLDETQLTGKTAEAFSKLPVKLNIFRMMANAPTTIVPQLRLGGAILGKQLLSHAHREMLIMQVAQIEGGAYEWRQHEPIAEAVGVSSAKIKAIENCDFAADIFSAPEQALLAFGKEVIENVRVPTAVFEAAKEHFSDQEIVEAILAIGFYMTMARLTEATETDLDAAEGVTVFKSTTSSLADGDSD